MAGWQPVMCRCGHTEAEHQSGGACGPLRKPRRGVCRRCDCLGFDPVDAPRDQSSREDGQ